MGHIAKPIRLPNVTGCLIAGLLTEPYCLKILPMNFAADINLISEIALAFIAFSGAELNLKILLRIGLIGIIYILARAAGKIAGSSIAGIIAEAPSAVKKHLGFALLPQACVAIGLSLLAVRQLPKYGETIRAAVLCAALIYELIGSAFTKAALKKAGEIA